MLSQCLRNKLGTGDTNCLGVCMNVGDNCALVRRSGLHTEGQCKMV